MFQPAKKRLVVLAILFQAALAPLAAHEDPAGNVYPIVSVKNQEFVVHYFNNTTNNSYYSVFNTLNQPLQEAVSTKETYEKPRLPVKKTEDGDFLVTFPDQATLLKKATLYTPAAEDKKPVALQWNKPESEFAHVASALEMDNYLFIHWVSDQPTASHFEVFDLSSGKNVVHKRLRDAAHIYFFPVADRAFEYNNRIFVPWVSGKGSLYLSFWKKGSNRIKTEYVQAAGTWNTSLSSAMLDSKLLIAWHGPKYVKQSEDLFGASIKTVVLDLSDRKWH